MAILEAVGAPLTSDVLENRVTLFRVAEIILPIGQLRQSDNICNIVFFRQMALPTQRALKVLAAKMALF